MRGESGASQMNFDASNIIHILNDQVGKIRENAGKGLTEAAEHVLGQAVRVVPIEEGTLQNSGTTATDAANLKAAIGFGTGAAAPYAVRQHEELTYVHDSGRSAKYLEKPLVASRNDVLAIIARHTEI